MLSIMFRKRLKSILMYGYAASYATSVILDRKLDELLERFDHRYLSEQQKIHQALLNIERPNISITDVSIYEIGKGGVLTSLYALSKELNCGLGIDMKNVPVIQSSVEISELYRLNPYNMLSRAYLIVTDNAEKTKEQMLIEGYDTVLIGALYDDNYKTINDKCGEGEELSSINRPDKDDIYKIIRDIN